MRKITTLLFLSLLASYQVKAIEQDTIENVLMFTYLSAVSIDWAQTKSFRAKGHEEINPGLGPYPSQNRVDTLIGGAILGALAFSEYILPEDWEPWFWGVLTAVELGAIIHNKRIGDGAIVHQMEGSYTISFEIKF